MGDMSTWTPDTPSTKEVLAAVLESPLPPLPAQESRYGATTISWWEMQPGEVYIYAEGGTADDRHFASTLTAIQLEGHGFRRAQFDMDEGGPEHRTSSWVDIMAKAKRLIQSGQVTLLRNGFNQVMGHVVGDHGEYDTEISRDDPQSRTITSWQCSCPWDQYAWQRTRKWKKFEGRPCAHVLALYWKALSTPLDEQLTEEQAAQMGTGQKLPGGPAPAPHGAPAPPGPHVFGPEGPIQGDQQHLPMNMPPEATGGPPGPAQAPLAPPPQGPQPPGIIPPFPGEQQQLPWAGPGTTPAGMESPPGAMSVPGSKPQSPFDPLQNPGTYSKVGADFNPPEIVRLKKPMYGLAEGPVPGQYGDGEYREVPAGSTGEVLSQDASTGWIEIIVPLDDSGYHEPFHVKCFVEPGDIEKTDQAPPGPFIKRRTKVSENDEQPVTSDETPDKWAPFNALRNPAACDRYLREIGIELHRGSTAEEIQRAVNMYNCSW